MSHFIIVLISLNRVVVSFFLVVGSLAFTLSPFVVQYKLPLFLADDLKKHTVLFKGLIFQKLQTCKVKKNSREHQNGSGGDDDMVA